MHSAQHCPANCQEDACTEVRLSGIKRLTVFVGIIPVALAVVIRPLQRSLLKIRGRSENEKKGSCIILSEIVLLRVHPMLCKPPLPPSPNPHPFKTTTTTTTKQASDCLWETKYRLESTNRCHHRRGKAWESYYKQRLLALPLSPSVLRKCLCEVFSKSCFKIFMWNVLQFVE